MRVRVFLSSLMDAFSGALAVTGFFCGSLGLIIFLDSRQQRAHVAYVAFILSVISWIISIVVLRETHNPDHLKPALAAAYTSGVAISVTLWYFVMFFTQHKLRPYLHVLVLGGASAIIALAFFSPDFITAVLDLGGGERHIILGSQHWLFIVFFAGMLATAFFRLYQRYHASRDPNERSALMLVFTGTLITAVIGSTLNILLVQLGNAQYIGWGPLSTIIMVTFIALAIIRNHFMSIRVIGTELFTIALIAALFAQAVFADSPFLRTINIVGVVLAVGFGTFLVRSVKHEIEQREHLRRMADTLKQANDQLEELGRMRSQFLSFASHQLKSPLAAIKWQAQLFTDGTFGTLPSTALEGARDIEAAADQLVRLVEDFLDMRRIEEGRMTYDFKRTNVVTMVQEIVKALTPAAEQKHLKLGCSADASKPWAMADQVKFRQVIQNLVDNAVKYTDAGSISVRIVNEGPNILMSVTDTGPGISRELVGEIFKQFVRGPATERKKEGSGLGLYIAKQIVLAHNGEIWATSAGTGKGSTFSVRIAAMQ